METVHNFTPLRTDRCKLLQTAQLIAMQSKGVQPPATVKSVEDAEICVFTLDCCVVVFSNVFRRGGFRV